MMCGVVIGGRLCARCQERQVAEWLSEEVSHRAAASFRRASAQLLQRCDCCSCQVTACPNCYLRRVATWVQRELPGAAAEFGADFGIRSYDILPVSRPMVP